MMRKFLGCCALILFTLLPGGAAARDNIGCHDPAYPQNAKVLVVASNMVMNGVPMAINELRWNEPPEQLLRFYRSRWEALGQKVFETPVGEWRTLGTLDGECYYTIQVKAAEDGSYALLGVTRAPRNAESAAPGKGFPMLSGSRVANDIEHKDGIKNARTLLLNNSFSIGANASFYLRALAGQGWDLMMDRSVATEKGPSRVLVWRRGGEEASMTIGRGAGGAMVVANIVDKP
jgi:hypothetical protein